MNGQISINGHGDVIKGEPWFEDGNILLVTKEIPTGYRVHQGVLSRHSEIFSHMLEMPQPTHSADLFEGCQIITLYDLPGELANLILALYDGPTFLNRNIGDFFYLAGILRLASKYFIAHLRRQAIQFLGITWPSTLEGHDVMIEAALTVRPVDNLTYPFVHPLHVLNLANEVDAPILIPSAIYFLSIYPLVDFIKGDHPKLLVEHPSRPSASLLSSDLLSYSLMYQHRLQLMDDFMHQFCKQHGSKPACGVSTACEKGFSRLVTQLQRIWNLKSGPLHFIAQAMQKVSSCSICSKCCSKFVHDCGDLRQRIWDELPMLLNLPTWQEMSRS